MLWRKLSSQGLEGWAPYGDPQPASGFSDSGIFSETFSLNVEESYDYGIHVKDKATNECNENLSPCGDSVETLTVVVDTKAPSKPNCYPGSGNHTETVSVNCSTDAGAEVLLLPLADGMVDLSALLKKLGSSQTTSILVEGGATLLGSLFDLDLVDKVVVFIAPVIVGGESARTAVGGQGIAKMVDSYHLKRVIVETLDNDVIVTGYTR